MEPERFVHNVIHATVVKILLRIASEHVDTFKMCKPSLQARMDTPSGPIVEDNREQFAPNKSLSFFVTIHPTGKGRTLHVTVYKDAFDAAVGAPFTNHHLRLSPNHNYHPHHNHEQQVPRSFATSNTKNSRPFSTSERKPPT